MGYNPVAKHSRTFNRSTVETDRSKEAPDDDIIEGLAEHYETLEEEDLPHYEKDDGPLTTAQIQYLRDNSPAKHISEERFVKLY